MAYIIGQNCSVILNGTGYLIKQQSFNHDKKRYFSHSITQVGTMFFIDTGPLFDEYNFTIVLYKGMIFRGTPITDDPLTLRNALWSLYEVVNTYFTFIDPVNNSSSCRFIDLKERYPEEMTFYESGGVFYPDSYEMDVQLLKTQ